MDCILKSVSRTNHFAKYLVEMTHAILIQVGLSVSNYAVTLDLPQSQQALDKLSVLSKLG